LKEKGRERLIIDNEVRENNKKIDRNKKDMGKNEKKKIK